MIVPYNKSRENFNLHLVYTTRANFSVCIGENGKIDFYGLRLHINSKNVSVLGSNFDENAMY